MYNFAFNGGICKKYLYRSEKFLLFFLSGGMETAFFPLVRSKVIKHYIPPDKKYVSLFERDDFVYLYQSPYPVVKIFIYQGGFGIPKLIKSFYFRIFNTFEAHHVHITPFSLKNTGYFFNAPGKFLTSDEINGVLSENASLSKSLGYYLKQPVLPINTIKSIMRVTYYEKPRKPGRRIRSL